MRENSVEMKDGPYELIISGSGIYVSPAIVIKSTGSVGASLLLWSVGPVVAISALLCWLELGLSIPKFEIPNTSHQEGEAKKKEENVPRSGGEKNYVSYIPCL